MKLIVGLGNPGAKYARTRHNVGFEVLDRVAQALGVSLDREKYRGVVAEATFGNHRLLLLKPTTYMNLSGVAVAQAARNHVNNPEDLVVVVDDVHLPLGRLRIRTGGTAGGHNGLKSVIEHLGTQDFVRLRIGVGLGIDGVDRVNHVLSTFTPVERVAIDQAIVRGAEAVLHTVSEGVASAMNKYNADAQPGNAADKG